jgi:ArsR family transcriptional regulator
MEVIILSLIQVMKAMSDETRVRIVNLLKNGDLCVCKIEVLLNINQSNASRHLNKLSGAEIVEYYKKAQYVYYKINWDTVEKYPFLREIIDNETSKLNQCIKDNERLEKYKSSGLSCEDLKEGKVCFNNEP